jgi:hypothetical protein
VRGVAFSVEKGPFSLPIFWAFVADASLRISLRYVPIFRRFIVGLASLLAFPIRRLQGLPGAGSVFMPAHRGRRVSAVWLRRESVGREHQKGVFWSGTMMTFRRIAWQLLFVLRGNTLGTRTLPSSMRGVP